MPGSKSIDEGEKEDDFNEDLSVEDEDEESSSNEEHDDDGEEGEDDEEEEDKDSDVSKRPSISFSMAHTLSMVRRRQEEKQLAEKEEKRTRELARKEKLREKARKHRQNQRAKAARLRAEQKTTAIPTTSDDKATKSTDTPVIEPSPKDQKMHGDPQLVKSVETIPSLSDEQPASKVATTGSGEEEKVSRPVKRPNPFVPRALMIKKNNTK